MTGQGLIKKKTQQLLFMCHMVKNDYISYLNFKTQVKSSRPNQSFDDS